MLRLVHQRPAICISYSDDELRTSATYTTMKDKENTSHGLKRLFPFRTLEISLGAIILILTLFEPLLSVYQSSVTTVQQSNDVTLALPDVREKRMEREGLKVHPWLPALNASHVKPLIREAAILLILQNIGVPLIGKFRTHVLVGIRCFIPLQRRLRGMLISRKMFTSLQRIITSPKVVRFVEKHVRLVWKLLLTAYSKTNASKLVNRCKKYLHTFLHSHHDDNDDHQHEKVKQKGSATELVTK